MYINICIVNCYNIYTYIYTFKRIYTLYLWVLRVKKYQLLKRLKAMQTFFCLIQSTF